jgi:hypothetical protein
MAAQGAQGSQGSQGSQGFQGFQGSAGAQGFQGFQGIVGAQAQQGSQGTQGFQGNQGFLGTQGGQGASGWQGVQGPQGTAGLQGAQGFQGNQGFIGSQGAQGVQGASGFQGSQGPQGFQSNIGAQGNQGDIGLQGSQGPQGVQANTGFQGGQGAQGNIGVTGPQGFQGFQGGQGAQGFQGFQGFQGSQGFQGPQGFQGAQGFQGLLGFQGPQGWQGVQGGQGQQGVQGVQGLQGAQGVQGAQGFQGAQGWQGWQGAQGSQGFQGFGAQGAQGPQGPGAALQQTITPTNSTSVNVIDPSKDIVFIDTSNFSALCSLAAPISNREITLRLLYQAGLSARIDLGSGAVLVLDPSIPVATLVYRSTYWTQIADSNTLGTFVAYTANQVKLIPTGEIGAAALASVALSASGNVLASGGPEDDSNIGAVWVWTRNSTTHVWTQQAKLIGSGYVNATNNVLQGFLVALSADGATLAFSGPFNNSDIGAVWVFTQSGGVWTQQAKLDPTGFIGTEVTMGIGLALSADGNVLAAGAPADNSVVGSVFLFTRSAGVWTQQQRLTSTDTDGTAQFGTSVAISSDGRTLLVSAPFDTSDSGACCIFHSDDLVTWTQIGSKFTAADTAPSDFFGSIISLSADGQTGAMATGTVTASNYVFSLANGIPVEIVKLYAPDSDAAQNENWLSADGSLLVVGSFQDNSQAGAVWNFYRGSNNNWTEYAKYTALSPIGASGLGSGMALSSDGSVMASPAFADNGSVGAVDVWQ